MDFSLVSISSLTPWIGELEGEMSREGQAKILATFFVLAAVALSVLVVWEMSAPGQSTPLVDTKTFIR